MSKKLITACLGLVAFAALALPASASASPVITHPTGEVLKPAEGSCTNVSQTICITGTNVGTTKFKTTSGSTLSECNSVTMTGYLTKNNGGEIEGTIHTATFSGTGNLQNGMNECTGAGGVFGNQTPTTNGGGVDENKVAEGTPWCMKSLANDEFQVRGGACGTPTRKITFILDTTKLFEPTKVIECKYERTTTTGPIKGTFTTHTTGDAILSLAPGANTAFTGEAGNPGECPSSGTLEMSFTLETDSAKVEQLYIS